MLASIGNFFKNDPARAFYVIRILIYVGAAVAAGQALDPDLLIELLGSVFGVAVVDGLTVGQTRKRTTPVETVDHVQDISSWGEVGVFAVEFVRSVANTFAPGASLAAALIVVAPVIKPFINQALTPALQKELQQKITKTLYDAKMLRRYDFGGE